MIKKAENIESIATGSQPKEVEEQKGQQSNPDLRVASETHSGVESEESLDGHNAEAEAISGSPKKMGSGNVIEMPVKKTGGAGLLNAFFDGEEAFENLKVDQGNAAEIVDALESEYKKAA